jgi:hypothetical protein
MAKIKAEPFAAPALRKFLLAISYICPLSFEPLHPFTEMA